MDDFRSSATNPINVLALARAPSGSAWVSIWVTSSKTRLLVRPDGS